MKCINSLQRKYWNPEFSLSDESAVTEKSMLSPSSPISLHFFTLGCPSSSGKRVNATSLPKITCVLGILSSMRLNFPHLGIGCRCHTSGENILIMKLLQNPAFSSIMVGFKDLKGLFQTN